MRVFRESCSCSNLQFGCKRDLSIVVRLFQCLLIDFHIHFHLHLMAFAKYANKHQEMADNLMNELWMRNCKSEKNFREENLLVYKRHPLISMERISAVQILYGKFDKWNPWFWPNEIYGSKYNINILLAAHWWNYLPNCSIFLFLLQTTATNNRERETSVEIVENNLWKIIF